MELLEQIITGWKSADFEVEGDFNQIAVVCEEPQFYQDVLGILNYFLIGVMSVPQGEFSVEAKTNQLFLADVDSTKSRRDDISQVLPILGQYLSEGTPVRTTNGSGEGTKGTRKYKAVSGPFEIYFN